MAKHMKSRTSKKEKIGLSQNEKLAGRKNKKTKKVNKIILIIRIISIIIMCVCVFELGKWFFENKKNDGILDDIITNYAQSTKEIIIGEEKVSVLDANFNDLLEINSDTVRMAYCKFN